MVSSHGYSHSFIENNDIDVEHMLPLDQSVSLSKISDIGDLLSVSQPHWPDSKSFPTKGAFCDHPHQRLDSFFIRITKS
jgi:hypothetical protein